MQFTHWLLYWQSASQTTLFKCSITSAKSFWSQHIVSPSCTFHLVRLSLRNPQQIKNFSIAMSLHIYHPPTTPFPPSKAQISSPTCWGWVQLIAKLNIFISVIVLVPGSRCIFSSLFFWIGTRWLPGQYNGSSCPMAAFGGFRESPGRSPSGKVHCIAAKCLFYR